VQQQLLAGLASEALQKDRLLERLAAAQVLRVAELAGMPALEERNRPVLPEPRILQGRIPEEPADLEELPSEEQELLAVQLEQEHLLSLPFFLALELQLVAVLPEAHLEGPSVVEPLELLAVVPVGAAEGRLGTEEVLVEDRRIVEVLPDIPEEPLEHPEVLAGQAGMRSAVLVLRP
jgi:hypothetical protein